jgi:hypothetical protein
MLPLELEVRREAELEQEIERAVADHLVRDLDVAGVRTPREPARPPVGFDTAENPFPTRRFRFRVLGNGCFADRKEAVMSEPAYRQEVEDDRPTTPPQGVVNRPVQRVAVENTTPVKAMAPGRGILRVLLTLLGVAGIVVSAFLHWVGGTTGIRLTDRAFLTTTFPTTSVFVATAGFVAIVIGLLALLGLTSLNGWPTRLAGALGLAAFILVLISIYRSPTMSLPQDIEAGLWVLLAGSLVCVIAGLIPTERVVERRHMASTG